MAIGLQAAINQVGQFAVFIRMGRMVVIKIDIKRGKIRLMFGFDIGDLLFSGMTQLLGFEHDRGTVGVIGTHISTIHPTQFLEAHPNVGLDIFHQMAEVDRTIGIRQCAGNQYFTSGNLAG